MSVQILPPLLKRPRRRRLSVAGVEIVALDVCQTFAMTRAWDGQATGRLRRRVHQRRSPHGRLRLGCRTMLTMTGELRLRPERVPRWLWGISAQELLSSAWKRRIRPQ